MKKSRPDAVYQITWLDAMGEQKADKEKLKDISPKDLLVRTETFGKLFKEDDVAIIILQEDSDSECDYTVIPKSWIIEKKVIK